MSLSREERRQLAAARRALQTPGLASKISTIIGSPIERSMSLLPGRWRQAVDEATKSALTKGLDFAVRTMPRSGGGASRDYLHKILVGASGGVGGALGLPALAIELPLTTMLMLRAIADIARSQGEDLGDLSARLACLEVFALGSAAPSEAAAESAYYATRAVLARQVTAAARFIADKGLAQEAPALVRLVATIARQFGVVVSEKLAAQSVPLVGGLFGASINVLFIDHFQEIARAHFTVRRLERIHGADEVRQAYEAEGQK